jgi:hypothetical protein
VNFICQAVAYAGIYECEIIDTSVLALEEKFIDHVSTYGISYGTDAEYQFRFQQFATNDAEIQRINADPENTYTVGHNKFSTMTKYEFQNVLGKKAAMEHDSVTALSTSNLSASVDWRTKGAVNPV